MQLQQQRGRLPPKKEKELHTILLSEILYHSRLWKQHDLIPQQRHLGSPPQIGEIDLERTCSIPPPRQPYELFLQARKPTTPHLSLLIDVSTSITAKQRFLSLVFAFALYQHPISLSISVFSTESHIIHTPSQRMLPHELLHNLLHKVPPGYTNLHTGLKILEKQQKQSRAKKTISIVLSDCVSNYGPQPHRNDFFLSELVLLCFRTPSNKSISGFEHVPTFSIDSMKTLALAFSRIHNYIIDNS